ncbi:hypothetical protein MA16_Dca023358 [Dendrobium catenatum]|uniref:Uncharacterized protein n=1 Tax=Dendrobium catenatum TaxID=906689 RepID=A0A2I0WJK9_9ASPA|nr:hypothetical protein MA16_Dca023358 [Dendrobium catenatum]
MYVFFLHQEGKKGFQGYVPSLGGSKRIPRNSDNLKVVDGRRPPLASGPLDDQRSSSRASIASVCSFSSSPHAFGDKKSSFVQIAKPKPKSGIPLIINEGGCFPKKELEVIGASSNEELVVGVKLKDINDEELCKRSSLKTKDLFSDLMEMVILDNLALVECTQKKVVEDSCFEKAGYAPWMLVNLGTNWLKNTVFKKFNQHPVEVVVWRKSKLMISKVKETKVGSNIKPVLQPVMDTTDVNRLRVTLFSQSK